jgi:hypothetical protein
MLCQSGAFQLPVPGAATVAVVPHRHLHCTRLAQCSVITILKVRVWADHEVTGRVRT